MLFKDWNQDYEAKESTGNPKKPRVLVDVVAQKGTDDAPFTSCSFLPFGHAVVNRSIRWFPMVTTVTPIEESDPTLTGGAPIQESRQPAANKWMSAINQIDRGAAGFRDILACNPSLACWDLV
jgi:hypothetical protein